MNKKTYGRLKTILCINTVCLFLLTFLSCGLETYVVLESPVSTIHVPNYSNIDKTENYFEFWTNEPDDNKTYPEDFDFLGTDIYYKIYNNVNQMINEVSAINTAAGSSTTSSKTPDLLMTSYKYNTLKANGNISSPIIPSSTGKNRRVYVRLTDYQNSNWASQISIDGNKIGDPGRNIVKNGVYLSFNFGRQGDNDVKPGSADSDVTYSSGNDDGKWYVAMYALASGKDTTFTYYYSNVLYLGSVLIDANEIDN